MRRQSVWTMVALTAVSFVHINAQSAGSTLPREDPNLYLMFFDFHYNLSLALEQKKANDFKAGANAEKAVAQFLKVKPTELYKVTEISRGVMAGLARANTDLKAFVDQARAGGREPDSATLQTYDQHRANLIETAVNQLKEDLSSESWNGLHAYINEQHRLHTRLLEFKPEP
jgi:hypothetical protein